MINQPGVIARRKYARPKAHPYTIVTVSLCANLLPLSRQRFLSMPKNIDSVGKYASIKNFFIYWGL
jgi:hypothetical protein